MIKKQNDKFVPRGRIVFISPINGRTVDSRGTFLLLPLLLLLLLLLLPLLLPLLMPLRDFLLEDPECDVMDALLV